MSGDKVVDVSNRFSVKTWDVPSPEKKVDEDFVALDVVVAEGEAKFM